MGLTFIQREAISQMISALSSRGWQRKETLKFFSDYGLPHQCSDLPLGTYYNSLRELPPSTKRDIIQRIFKAWISLHNYSSLAIYEAFKLLVYLKISAGVEFFFLNSLCSLLDYFGGNGIKGESSDDSHYKLYYGSSEKMIEFHLNENSDVLVIHISGNLLNGKSPFNDKPTPQQKDSLLSCISSLPLTSTMPWIYASSEIEYEYKKDTGKGYVQITLTDIEYSDNNGVF